MTDATTAPSPTAPEPHGPDRPWRPGAHGARTIFLFVLVVVAGIAIVLTAWKLPPFTSSVEATEDAYVQAHTTVISPQVSGYVQRIAVEDYARVKAGQLLVVIDQSLYRQRLEQAYAELDARLANLANNRQSHNQSRAGVAAQLAARASAEAQLARAREDLRRSSDLIRDGSLSRREHDQNVAALRQAEAAVRQADAAIDNARQQVVAVGVSEGALKAAVEGAKAQLHAAQIDLGHTIIRAPQAGRLSEVGTRLGQFVTNGTALLYLVPDQRWVSANFKEKQTRHMAEGQTAWFTVDALGSARIRGHVERISPATGSEFAILKPDNATGNFTKVPQRISVRIAIDPGQPLVARLRPGMSVEAHVDTGDAR
jgi:multidrug resistance efflux pump